MPTPSPALKGRNMTARGEAPGNASRKFPPALKGRHNPTLSTWRFALGFCPAPSGLTLNSTLVPGALPRAITSRPFRADRCCSVGVIQSVTNCNRSKMSADDSETQRLASLYTRKLAALEALKTSLWHQTFT